jgi:hypothetical protein
MRAAALLLALAAALPAQETPAPAPTAEPSPWYLERGTQPRVAGPLDPVPEAVGLLVALLRDGRVPGFYDGQFASLAGRFDELAALARDPDLNHTLRVMAVMALAEVGSGAAVAEVLDPLVIPAQDEFSIEFRAWDAAGRDDSPAFIEMLRVASLSQHARFALGKDGQPERVLEKIREMEFRVRRQLPDVLDPGIDSERSPGIAWSRQVVFDIGYHYQQYDDFAKASEWFELLTDALPGHRDTRWPHYNLACIAALQGRPDEAIAHLQAAWKVGFSDVAWMLEDGDLASLRERADFQELAGRMRGRNPDPIRSGEPAPGPP